MVNSEINTVYKHLRKNFVRIALVYPSSYEVMSSSLAIHILYYLLNETYEEVYVERFHAGKLNNFEQEARSIETNTPLSKFDLIITSLHYEPDIAKFIRLLYYSRVEPRRFLREKTVIAGGPLIIANPKPFSDFFDVMIVGEIEETICNIINTWLMYRDNKKVFLEEVSKLEYTYIPGVDERDKLIYKNYTKNLDQSYYPIKQFYSLDREPVLGKGFILETSRGCRFWCRFCLEGRIFNPYRLRSYSILKELVDKGLSVNKLNRVIIYSLIYPSSVDEKRILEYIVDNNLKCSIPSIRIDLLDKDTIELIKNTGQKTISIAPESFNNSIQRLICKYCNLDKIIDKIYELIEQGFDLKMYLIYGFKNEKIEDIYKNIDVIRSIAKKAREKKTKVKISINPLIPKPWTVFQWIGMIDLDKAIKILALYRRELNELVETRPLDINWSWVQASIALADEYIGKLLLEWSIEGGDLGSWRRVIKRNNYSTQYVFKGYRYGDKLPWSNIVLDPITNKLCEKEYEILKNIFRE